MLYEVITNDIEAKKYETNSNVQPLVEKDQKIYAGMQLTDVITSYSIHYTKLYEL